MTENETVRIEKDSLGTKEVPADVYYGIQTQRAQENFPITGYPLAKELIVANGMVKKAAALANHHVGELSKEFTDAIVKASEELIDGKMHDDFIVDPIQGGAGTSINMNANEIIANRALEILGKDKGDYDYLSPNTHVNMAQSTNDAFPTALRLTLLILADRLTANLDDLYEAFTLKAQEFDQTIKMGRTHLQDAVPIRLGQEFKAYAYAVKRGRDRIARARDNMLTINMGATAVGTGLNAKPAYIEKVISELSEISGYPLKNADYLVDATQNSDEYVELSSTLKASMVSISKIANDLRLMASGPRTGFFEINLPAVQPGSSIMPGKVNPVMAEVMSQIAFQVMGNDTTVTAAAEAGQFELNVMDPVLAYNLIESLQIMTNGVRVFTDYCITGITANTKQMKDYVDKSVGTITAINPHIGYTRASEIAKEALATDRPVRDIASESGVLSEEELNQLFDPTAMTEPGIIEIKPDK